MARKKAKKQEKKEKYVPIPGSAVADQQGTVKYEHKSDPSSFAPVESDNEEMSEAEVEAMERRSAQKKQAAIAKVEAEVDAQEWTLMDPVIPENLVGRVWVAVYRCPEGHKTKATNRQAESGVFCWKHRESGQKVKAEIMPQFLSRPITEDPDVAKRKKAAKGAQ